MKRKGLSLAIILAGLCTVDMVNAETTSLGLGVGMSDYGYRDTDNLVFPLPVINYEKGNFFIHSLSTGYYLWKNENNKIAVDAWYNPLSFNPDDSDSAQMNQLDKRHSTVMAGFTWDHFQRWGLSIRPFQVTFSVIAMVGLLKPPGSTLFTQGIGKLYLPLVSPGIVQIRTIITMA